MPPRYKCFGGILESACLSVHPCVCPCMCPSVQKTSFYQSNGGGIMSHLVTALVVFGHLYPFHILVYLESVKSPQCNTKEKMIIACRILFSIPCMYTLSYAQLQGFLRRQFKSRSDYKFSAVELGSTLSDVMKFHQFDCRNMGSFDKGTIIDLIVL